MRNQVDYFSSFYQILLLLGHATNDIKSLWLELKDNDYYKINKIKFWFDYNQQIKQILKTFKIEKKNIICKSYDECKNNLLDTLTSLSDWIELIALVYIPTDNTELSVISLYLVA